MHTTNNCQVRPRRKTDKGAILMVVLIVMIALLGLGMTGLFLTSGSIQMNTNINLRNQALVVAEAGIERARGVLNNQTWVPPVPTMLMGSTTSADEVPVSAADCQGARRGAILVDKITSNCATTPTPASCTLQNVTYPSLDRTADLPAGTGGAGIGTIARATMGTYTVFIRQDQADCRMGNYTCEFVPVAAGVIDGGAGGGGGGGTSGATTCTVPVGVPAPNGSLVIRSEGLASDGKTRVVLEVTMTPSQGAAKANNTPMSALCAAGANGCDDNSSVQNGIVVNSNIAQQAPPSLGGATSLGGAPGAGGAGGTVTVPVTGPTGGGPSTGGATGTGGAGTGGATGTGGSTSCPVDSCKSVATMGIEGPWNIKWSSNTNGGMGSVVATGNTFFDAWLKAHASACNVPNIDITDPTDPPTHPITAATLSPYKIIIVLDLCHKMDDYYSWIGAKGASGGTPDYWCNQRLLQASEATAVKNWVNNGGRMMTTVGYHNYGYQNGTPEATNVNMLIRPFGVTYSVTTNPNEVRLYGGGRTDITGFSYIAPISSAIDNGPFGKVTLLLVSAATLVKGWTGSADTGLPQESNTFTRYAAGPNNYALGAALIANPYSSHPGKVAVWGDEWITYDDVWTDNGLNDNKYQADWYWENLFTWFEQGCTP